MACSRVKFEPDVGFVDWVTGLLSEGPCSSRVILDRAKELGITPNALTKQYKKLFGVVSIRKRHGRNPPWHWALPGSFDTELWVEGKAAAASLEGSRPLERGLLVDGSLDMSLERLGTIGYSKEEKLAVVKWCKRNKVWSGDFGFEEAMLRYRPLLLKPRGEAWRLAGRDLQSNIAAGRIKLSDNPYSESDAPKVRLTQSTADELHLERFLKIGRDRKASSREELRWVVIHIPVPWKAIEDDRIPSDYAVSLLVLAKKSPTDFMRIVASKLVPTNLQDDGEKSFQDDGRTDELLEEQIRELGVSV